MTLLAGVLLASLIGSVHCGAMCSAFACLANGNARRDGWYHGGRLVAYVALGASAGVIGAGLDRAGGMANVQRAAALATSVALIVWGAMQFRRATVPQQHATASRWGTMVARLTVRASRWDPRVRATTIGLVTALLPCGWLWAFVATAMGTGSPLRASIVMAVFWVGTVPMLLAVVSGARRWGPMACVRWPLASASIIVILGFGELASHLLMPTGPSSGAAHLSHLVR